MSRSGRLLAELMMKPPWHKVIKKIKYSKNVFGSSVYYIHDKMMKDHKILESRYNMRVLPYKPSSLITLSITGNCIKPVD